MRPEGIKQFHANAPKQLGITWLALAPPSLRQINFRDGFCPKRAVYWRERKRKVSEFGCLAPCPTPSGVSIRLSGDLVPTDHFTPLSRTPSMSAFGQKQTSKLVRAMSALPPKADIATGLPRRNSGSFARSSLFFQISFARRRTCMTGATRLSFCNSWGCLCMRHCKREYRECEKNQCHRADEATHDRQSDRLRFLHWSSSGY